MIETTTPFPPGTKVRVTREVREYQPPGWTLAENTQFVIEEFLTAGDPDRGEIGVDFYYGSADGGINNVTCPADAVALVMSAQDMAARQLPSLDAVREALSSAVCGMDADGFEISEVEKSGATLLDCYGRTRDGLAFSFGIQVSYPQGVRE